jgi:polygalacturonase
MDENLMTDVSQSKNFQISPSAEQPVGAKLNHILDEGHLNLSFPAGTYLIEETIRLPSGTQWLLDPDAHFILADGAAQTENDYLLANADPVSGNENIRIQGGIFDGNQKGNPRPPGLFDPGYTGAMIHFENVRGLELRNMVMTNAEAYYCRCTHVHDFHVEGVTFDSELIRHNNDGIHLGGNCSHGVIRNIRASRPGVTGDDLVALNADDALERNEVRGMSCGNITDILIEDLQADSCHTFVRLLCVTSRIKNVTIRKVRGGCQVGVLNADGARNCRVPVFDENNPPFEDGVGLLENIVVEDVEVHKVGQNPLALVDIQERLSNVQIRNFHRNRENDEAPEIPTVRFRYLQIEQGTLNDGSLDGVDTLSGEEPFESDETSIDLRIAPRSTA